MTIKCRAIKQQQKPLKQQYLTTHMRVSVDNKHHVYLYYWNKKFANLKKVCNIIPFSQMNYFSSGISLAEVDKLLSSLVGPSSAYVYYALSKTNIHIDPYLVHVDYLPSASNSIPSNLFTRTLPGNLLSSASIHTW